MKPNGKYEQKMREVTEIIFSIEPYKSLRSRFNVYGVKVVSPNSEVYYGKGRIEGFPPYAFEYATKVPTECPLIAVIMNGSITWGRSSCSVFEDGSCYAHIISPGDDAIIHELCGHGIGHLTDEYVEYGYENLRIPDSKIEEMKNNAILYKWGYGMNVDYDNNPKTIRWAHLLADERFQNEDLGIYEGAKYGYGIYRPSDDSMMRCNIFWFNAPSREAIYKTVMTRSEGDDWEYNYEDFVTFDEAARNTFISSRAMSKKVSEKEKTEIHKRHCPPILINSTWREALKWRDSRINVSLIDKVLLTKF